MPTRIGLAALTTALALLLAGCTGGDGGASTSSGADPGSSETPPAPGSVGPSGTASAPADFAEEAAGIVESFSDDELAGSLIIGTWSGRGSQAAVDMVRQNDLGGVIVMADNLSENPTPEEVTALTDDISGARGGGQPVSIGVDQEGGPVSRLDTAALPFPPLMALAAAGDPALTTQATEVQARNLVDLGFTIDFAPDSDVTIGPQDVTINVRSAGSDPQAVAEVVAQAVAGYQAGGVASSAKHFPGHGRLTVDSHESLPVSEFSIDELESTDLLPFKSAVEAGVPLVMMGHIGLPDAKTTPASLNPDAYAAMRDKLGFDGVAITDALNMEAVPQNENGGETVSALKAGADLALMPPDAAAAQKAIVAAMNDGTLQRDDLVEKSRRVVAMQLATAEVQGRESAGAAGGDTDPDTVLTDVAEQSVTVLKGQCEYAGTDSISIVGGSEEERSAFAEAAEQAGLSVGSGGTTVTLSPRASAEVAIGTAAPWTLRSTPAQTAVTAYDSNPYAFAAVAKWLKGDLAATGSLPVEYDGSDAAPSCSG